jgi:hypothetical protein
MGSLSPECFVYLVVDSAFHPFENPSGWIANGLSGKYTVELEAILAI